MYLFCIALTGLQQLYVDATLIDKFYVNPLHFLIVYALSGCDICSFVRNISKKKFMQMLFRSPAGYNNLETFTQPLIMQEDVSLIFLYLYYLRLFICMI